ncbi:hypothetical protein A5654_07975 [Mycolicibacterium fortuitum]|nr:hypothetical protein A5654_07975 [Mycolicibacterium fortuitum]
MITTVGRMIYGAAEQVAAPFVRPVQTALAAAAEMVGGPRATCLAWRRAVLDRGARSAGR